MGIYLSFKSAKEAESEGFKKPDLAEGQIWYNSMGHASKIIKVSPTEATSVSIYSGKETKHELPLGDMNVYCPTAEEWVDFILDKQPDLCLKK